MSEWTVQQKSGSRKREDFATWSTLFIAYIQMKHFSETLAGTAIKPVEPASLVRRMSRARLKELQQKNLKTIRKSDIKKTLWYLLAVTLFLRSQVYC